MPSEKELLRAQMVWDAMASAAEMDGGDLVWEGYTTKLFSDLGLSVPYYTKVLQALRSMRCIEQITRGGGRGMSKWLLLKPPSMELLQKAVARPVSNTTSLKGEALAQQIRGLQNQIRGLQNQIYELEARILEAR